MRLKRKLAIALLALGSFAVVTGFGAAPAGAATPENLISDAQFDMLWEGMSQPAVDAFLGKSLTNIAWGASNWDTGVYYNVQLWKYHGQVGNCYQDVYFYFTDADPDGTTHPMYLTDWFQEQTPACEGIIK